MKKISLTLTALLIAVTLAACSSESSSNHKDAKKGSEVKTEKKQNNVKKNDVNNPKQSEDNQKKQSNETQTSDKNTTTNKKSTKDAKKGGPLTDDEALALANKYNPNPTDENGPFIKVSQFQDSDGSISVRTKEKVSEGDQNAEPEVDSNGYDYSAPIKSDTYAVIKPVDDNQVEIKMGVWTSRTASHMPFFDQVVSRY